MPNCFSLTSRTTHQPTTFNQIDAELCAHFDQPCDPKRYLADWYTVLGTLIAVKGLRLPSLALRLVVVEWYKDGYNGLIDVPTRRAYMGDMIRILKWIETRYTSDAWVEIGKR